MDLFIDEVHAFVSVVEIKATDWDKVISANRRKLLGTHRRQMMKYVDKYVDGDGISVCAGFVYPRKPGLTEEVDAFLNDHAFQVVWWYDDQ